MFPINIISKNKRNKGFESEEKEIRFTKWKTKSISRIKCRVYIYKTISDTDLFKNCYFYTLVSSCI